MSSPRPPRGGGRGSETRRRRGVVFIIPSPSIHLLSFIFQPPPYFFLLPFFHPPPFPLCPSLVVARLLVAAKYHKFGLRFGRRWGGRGGESASNEPIAENLSSRARRDPTSHPPPPTCSLFTPSSPPDCPGFIPGHCPRRVLPRETPLRRRGHETGIERSWKDWREREPPFDHRFAAAREIAVFFAPDGKWPRFCPSVFFFCQLLLARLSIVRCIRCQSSRSSNNISNQLSEEDSTKN